MEGAHPVEVARGEALDAGEGGGQARGKPVDLGESEAPIIAAIVSYPLSFRSQTGSLVTRQGSFFIYFPTVELPVDRSLFAVPPPPGVTEWDQGSENISAANIRDTVSDIADSVRDFGQAW